jgi:hypothetical protein
VVEVIIPWSPGCEYRERALRWVEHRYRDLGLPVRLGVLVEQEWCKARAISAALRASTADISAIADADVWTDGLLEAVAAVEEGAPWAIPHLQVHRLDEKATGRVLAGADWLDQPLAERPYRGIEGGGVVVAPREVIDSIPPDCRFKGWGQEDESWACALHSLLGPAWRGEAHLYHLWHPPQERMTRRRGSQESWRLRNRYFAARNDPDAMRRLIEESRESQAASQPTRDDRPALR